MGMPFIHSVLQPPITVVADGILSYDLPVNPLSALLISLQPLNNTATITNFGLVQRMLSAIDNINVTHNGVSVFQMSGADAYAYSTLVQGIDISQANQVTTDNDRRCLVLPVVFGRSFANALECLPSTTRGELQAQITWDIADTGFDALQIALETVELPDATPEFFQRPTTLTQAFGATGDNDVDLPIGHALRGVLCFGTTAWAGAVPAPTLGRMSVLRDNLQFGYASTDFETARLIGQLSGRRLSAWNEHLHGFVDAAAGQAVTQRQSDIFPLMENYVYLPFDLANDDMYTLDTAGASDLVLRCNAETADTVRIIPVQKFPVAGLPRSRRISL